MTGPNDPDLADAVTKAVGRNTPLSVHVVSGVNADGSVNLDAGRETLDSVPALTSYTYRAEGDRVVVLKGRGLWVVLGTTGMETT